MPRNAMKHSAKAVMEWGYLYAGKGNSKNAGSNQDESTVDHCLRMRYMSPTINRCVFRSFMY